MKAQPIILTLLTFWSLSETFIRGRSWFFRFLTLRELDMSRKWSYV